MTKRALDILLASAILLFVSPLLALVSLLVLMESGSPILFKQERVGIGIRRFRILKFRTMYNNVHGPKITIGGDKRVTEVGRFLRATKIDELPQFFNVLSGDMSIVGPRPEVPEFVEMFKDRYRRVLSVRPGITDIASVIFRDEEKILSESKDPLLEYRERILPLKLELAEIYIGARGFFLDLGIIVATAMSIVNRELGQRILAHIAPPSRQLSIHLSANENPTKKSNVN